MPKESNYLKKLKKLSASTGAKFLGRDTGLIPQTNNIYISSDQFIEDVHFDLKYMSLKDAGFKAVVTALSDLAAMGANPLGLVVSISWPHQYNTKIDNLFEGIYSACKLYKTKWLGGDISSNKKQIYIDITVIGKTSYPWSSKKPKPGELIVATGPLGLARAGHQLCKLKSSTGFISSFLRPKAKIEIGKLVTKKFNPSFMTDISDGLYREVIELCDNYKLGAKLNLNNNIINKKLLNWCLKQKLMPLDFYLGGGEDYELLFTCSDKYEKQLLKTDFYILGTLTQSKNLEIYFNNQKINPKPSWGWDSFR